MKKSILRLTLISTGLFFSIGLTNAQEASEKKIEKKKICKNVDGEKFVKIVTIQDGKRSEITLTGDDANKYMDKSGSHNTSASYSYSSDDDRERTVIVKSSAALDVQEIESDGEEIRVIKHKRGPSDKEITKRIEHKIIINSDEGAEVMSEEEVDRIMRRIDTELNRIDELGLDTEVLKETIRESIEKENVGTEKEVETTVIIGDKRAEDSDVKVIEKRIVLDKVEDADVEIEIIDETPQLDVSIYPNPSQGEFSLSFEDIDKGNAQLTITDINGKTAHKQKLKVNKGSKETLDLDLKSGVYMLNIEQGKKNRSKKLIIE
jgi:hypothetical protein